MRSYSASAVIIFVFGLGTAPDLRAQPPGVNRVLHTFDFEERRQGNVEDLPMHWTKIDGPGLPHYVNARLATDRHRSGQHSFRFDLNGGGAVYRYPANRIKAQAGAHYRVEGFVQTTLLANARARISAYFVDEDGRTIESSVRHSELYASTAGDADWKRLSIELSADDARAASLVIELGLLQPMHFASPVLGGRTLFAQDIHGTAWFDDVTVSQVPQVRMSTDRPGNIFARSDSLLLHVLVNDRFIDDLNAQLVVTDAEGNIVHQRSGALDMSAAENLGPGRRGMTIQLPSLKPGWYSASLVMTSQGQFVGKQSVDLVLLADDGPPVLPDDRFGVIATDLPFAGWGDLPQILPQLAAGRVKLAVWSKAGDIQTVDSSSFDRLLNQLGERHIEPTACLLDLPPLLAGQLQSDSWLEILKSDASIWQPPLAMLIARHANHLSRWQLGADGSDLFVNQSEMREVYRRIYDEFSRLIQQPDLAMPWPAWYEMEGQLPATIALHVKPEVLPSQLPFYIHDLRAHEGQNLSLYIEPVDRQRYGREVQIRDLAQRIVYALSADARRIDVKLPFTATRASGAVDDSEITPKPQELFMIVRTLMTTLSGTTFRGKVPVADGVEAFLFDKNGQGIIILWDRGNVGGMKQLAINLGPNAVRVDLWGNATPLLNGTGAGSVKIDVGPMPIFLVDVDGPLAQLRASVAFDNPLLESSFKPHTRKLRFVNPYHQTIAGSFKLKAPAGWVLNPPTGSFSLNPGEIFERDLTIEFPYNSFAGTKIIDAELQVQADNLATLTVPVMLKLGLSDVGLQTLALRDGDDVIVQQMITNYGERPIDYSAFALYPGKARQERLVTNLAPGRTTIKKYRFTDVKFANEPKVRSGVKELDGTRILNDEVTIR